MKSKTEELREMIISLRLTVEDLEEDWDEIYQKVEKVRFDSSDDDEDSENLELDDAEDELFILQSKLAYEVEQLKALEYELLKLGFALDEEGDLIIAEFVLPGQLSLF